MEIKNFAIIKGSGVKLEKNRVYLKSEEIIKEDQTKVKEMASADIRSDINFSSGIIEFKFKANTYATGALLWLNTPDDKGASVGLSKTYDSIIIGEGNNQIRPLVKAGSFKNYNLKEEHIMRIEVKGSLIKAFFDNILIVEYNLSIKENYIAFRFSTEAEMEIYDFKVISTKPNIFVIMQFTKEFNDLFKEVIKPIVESEGFECIRADEFYTSTPILKDITDSIHNSTAIIAEMTPDNPNVFYEIGYSHAINKPTILLCDKKRDKLPFDTSSFRTLFYENTIAGKKKIEDSLKKYLQNIK